MKGGVKNHRVRKAAGAVSAIGRFLYDVGTLVNDYQAQGLPVPPEEQLREEAIAEARKCLETMMVCDRAVRAECDLICDIVWHDILLLQ